MKYNNHLNYQDRKHFLFKVRLIIISILSLAIMTGAYIYFNLMLQREANTEGSTTSQQTSSYFAPTVNIFRSPYFQFQANNSWAEVPSESTSSKYVYRSLRSNLIEHELVIYVNQIPANLSANHILPVNLKSGGELLPMSVSEHCSKAMVTPSSQSREVLMDRVKFLCHSDSTTYTVLVGQADGNSSLNLLRPDNATTSYSILYTNLKANPESAQLMQIIESFQTR